MRASKGKHPSYPLFDKTYDLKRLPKDIFVTGDIWAVELTYNEVADYYPGLDFAPDQRVAFALELYDAAESRAAVSPQSFLQALPIAATMNRLSMTPVGVRTPVVIRSRA